MTCNRWAMAELEADADRFNAALGRLTAKLGALDAGDRRCAGGPVGGDMADAAAPSTVAQGAEALTMDGSFILVDRGDDRPALVRLPEERRGGDIPHLRAGHPVCRFALDCPPELVERIVEMLNEAAAWDQI